jgi:hypothetical protein
MKSIDYLEAIEFNDETVTALKGSKKLYVIFSTFGEREAELIYQKISLIDFNRKKYNHTKKASKKVNIPIGKPTPPI